MTEIVYVPDLGELHWYGCYRIRRVRLRLGYIPWPRVDADAISCGTCRMVMGLPPWG